jgi:uncharacterized membrane protein
MPFLRELFYWVCSQQPSWVLGGIDLPFCQRCTGLYVGVVPALLMYFMFKPRPSTPTLWVHGMLLLFMAPFGYHLIPQNAELRTLTGQLFAYGLVYYLMLLPAGRLRLWERSLASDTQGYYLAGLATLPLLQLGVHLGGERTSTLLSWIGFTGLVLYAVLAVANLVLVPFTLWPARLHEPDTSSS